MKKIDLNISISFINKNNFANKILRTYNFNKNKNEFRKGLRKVNSARVKKLSNEKNINKRNDASLIIENLYKELSNSKCFSKKINRIINKKILVKTDYKSNKKKMNYFFKNNNTYCGYHFRNNTIKNIEHSKYDNKDFFIKNDLFLSIKI